MTGVMSDIDNGPAPDIHDSGFQGRTESKEVTIPMRYDEYDDYNSRDRRDGRSRSPSSYDRSSSRSRDSYQSSYDRDRRSSSRSMLFTASGFRSSKGEPLDGKL